MKKIYENLLGMSVNVAEVVREIKSYSCLQSFDETTLHLIAGLMKPVSFFMGRTVVKAHEANDVLYFLRTGIVDLFMESDKIAEFRKAGDVLGEITTFTNHLVSGEARAQTVVSCFALSVSDVIGRDPAQKILRENWFHRLYLQALTDRMLQISEKAKFYEITARELKLLKRELNPDPTQTLALATAASARKRVLIVEPVKKQQNVIKTSIGGAGVQLFLASTVDEAKKLFSEAQPDLMFCDSSLTEFLFWAQQESYQGESVLLESGQIDFNRLTTLPFVQNVVSRNLEDRAGTTKGILTSLSKILNNDYFGIEKYLAWGTEIRTIEVEGSKAREAIKSEMISHLHELGLRSAILDRAQIVAEEMMMNAVYDAPVDARGTSLYNHLPRTTEVVLHDNQRSKFRYGCDGNTLAVSISDPFGSLPRYVIINYLESCYANQAGLLNGEKGGAGRGLHQILENCDCTIFNIKAGERTEVIGLFDLAQKQSAFPQFHYFFLK